MPRQARGQSPTNYYHLMMRGNNRESIFNNDKHKQCYLDVLLKQCEDGFMEIAAYCIMDNHVHLVVKAELADLAKAIKAANIKFAMVFNHQTDRVGHVFQDRYKSEAIKDDNYLLQVIRYVHNNPVKAKMVKKPEYYPWSSYNEFLSEIKVLSKNQKEFVLGYFSGNKKLYIDFHRAKDDNEYLETKEDQVKERLEHGQEVISTYFEEKGLKDAKQSKGNPEFIEEIIIELLNKSRLTHRQIAYLLGVTNSTVHKVNLGK